MGKQRAIAGAATAGSLSVSRALSLSSVPGSVVFLRNVVIGFVISFICCFVCMGIRLAGGAVTEDSFGSLIDVCCGFAFGSLISVRLAQRLTFK